MKDNTMDFVKPFMVDENGIGGYSITLEDTNLVPVYNQVQYVQPAFIQMQPCECVEKTKWIDGEILCIDEKGNQMVALNSKVTVTRYPYKDKKINYKDFRYVSVGIVKNCKRFNYVSEHGTKFFYEISTKGADKNTYSFEVSQEEFDGNLLKVLCERGKIEFKRYSAYKDDTDLVRNLIIYKTKEVKRILPYIPSWSEGEYLYATQKHLADTPFFNNTIKLDSDESELTVLKRVSGLLKVCKKPRHRLFFLILSAYVVLQSRFSETMRIGQPFSINLSKKMEKFPQMLLNIFENSRGVSCNLAEKRDKINELRKNRTGTVFFLNNGKGENKYFDKKSAENLAYAIKTHVSDTVAVIVNSHCASYVNGAFNITIKDIDVDEDLYYKMDEAMRHMSRFMVDFAYWVYCEEKAIPRISDDSKEICNVEKVFKIIYLLLSEYNDSVSETTLAQKIGVVDDEAVFEEIKAICSKQDDYAGGEWILESIGKIYRDLCSSGQCQKVFLKKGSDFTFKDGIITFVEIDGLLCLREKDLKLLVDTHMSDVPLEVVKASLKEADALECDKGQPYLKNFFISCLNKRVRLLAIKKEMIDSIGGIKL